MQDCQLTPPTPDKENAQLIDRLREMHPSDIAAELDDMDIPRIRLCLRHFNQDTVASILAELPREIQTGLLENMRPERIGEIIPEMHSDDAVDALGHLSPERLKEIFKQLPTDDVAELTDLMEYAEDTAGGIMQTEVIAVQVDMTLAEAREAIREYEDQQEEASLYIYAVDRENRLAGVLRLRDLLFRDLRLKVSDVMITEVHSVNIAADQEEIANRFQRYNYIAIPVVDDDNRLVGLVTSDDVMDVLQEEATEDMQRMVGISGEEMVFTPWTRSYRNRVPWLCVNLVTAFCVAWVVSLFEASIDRYAVLAIFLPIVGLLGGNAGSQTLTIVVRSMALGEINGPQWRDILAKEILVGITVGITIGLIVGLISWLWKGSYILGAVASIAMLLNMVAAAMAGVMVPIGLRSLKIDPALASSIMVTTVTDVVGFFLFLSLATIAIRYFPIYQ